MTYILTDNEKSFLNEICRPAWEDTRKQGKETLGGHCLPLSSVAAIVLTERRFRNANWRVVGGDVETPTGRVGHFWLEGNSADRSFFLDITSDQFGYVCPSFLAKRPENYHLGQQPSDLFEHAIQEMVVEARERLGKFDLAPDN